MMRRGWTSFLGLTGILLAGCVGSPGQPGSSKANSPDAQELPPIKRWSQDELLEKARASLATIATWMPVAPQTKLAGAEVAAYQRQLVADATPIEKEVMVLEVLLQELQLRENPNEPTPFDARPRAVFVARLVEHLTQLPGIDPETHRAVVEEFLLRFAFAHMHESLEPTGFYPCKEDCQAIYEAYEPIQRARSGSVYPSSGIAAVVDGEALKDPGSKSDSVASEGNCHFGGKLRNAHVLVSSAEGTPLGALLSANLQTFELKPTTENTSEATTSWPFQGSVVLDHSGLFELQKRQTVIEGHVHFDSGSRIAKLLRDGEKVQVELEYHSIKSDGPFKTRIECGDLMLTHRKQDFLGEHKADAGSRLLADPGGEELGRLRTDSPSVVTRIETRDGYAHVRSVPSAAPFFDGWIRETFVAPLGPSVWGETYKTHSPTHTTVREVEILTSTGAPTGLRLPPDSPTRVYPEDPSPENAAVAIPSLVPVDGKRPFRLPREALKRLPGPDSAELGKAASQVAALSKKSLDRTLASY